MRGAEAGLLLLCCRLGEDVTPLTSREYRILMQRVTSSHLTGTEVTVEHLCSLGYGAEESGRIVSLLAREDALEAYLSAARRQGIAVLTRIADGFPQRLRRLQMDCPATLFCRGDVKLLQSRCVSLVGARNIMPENREFACRVGLLAAREGVTLVTGGARGADTAAQEACLQAGGSAICFVPDELYRHPPRERVLYCSADGFAQPFTSIRALSRNGLIHALGEKTVVAQAGLRSGGSWSGTVDNLRRRLSEVYVFEDGSEAARTLCELGATPVAASVRSLLDLHPLQLSIFD